MPITDITGYTWVGNSTIQYNSKFPTYNINYKAYYNNGANYNTGTSLYMQSFVDPPMATFYGLCGSGLSSFSGVFFPSCIYEGNTTTMTPTSNQSTLEYIEFTGGTDATNPDLIAWLEANGTLTAPIQANTYNLTHTLTNLTKGNITLQITPDNGYTYPTTLTISNGTLVSYDNTTGIAVISGDDTAIVSGECVAQASGYEVQITFQNGISTYNWVSTKIYSDYVGESGDEGDKIYLNSSNEIGSISAADGFTTITTTTGKLFVLGRTNSGYYSENTGTITCSNGITNTGKSSGLQGSYGDLAGVVSIYVDNVQLPDFHECLCYIFEVEADGTITINGADWED